MAQPCIALRLESTCHKCATPAITHWIARLPIVLARGCQVKLLVAYRKCGPLAAGRGAHCDANSLSQNQRGSERPKFARFILRERSSNETFAHHCARRA